MDDDLIRRARDGEADAISRIYERHASRVYAIVRRLAGDEVQAEDWAQEAWLMIVRGLPNYRGEAQFTTWLHRVAINTALQGIRRRSRLRKYLVEGDTVPEPAAAAEHPHLRLSLEKAIDRLPPGMRHILVLHDVEGYTHVEIAGLLGVSAGTCKSQLFKARAKMREQLEPRTTRIEGEKVCAT